MPLIMNADGGSLNGLAARACDLCHRKDGILRCSACQAIYYCGRDCQTKDRDIHRTPCKAIKKARLRYEFEEKKLRDTTGDWLRPDIFENHVGLFWAISETQPHMRARYELVDAMLLSYGTAGGPADVAQMALDHLLDMMRLCRCDNMRVRFIFDSQGPGCLRLYEVPFLDIKGVDVLEAPAKGWTNTAFLDLSHAVAAVLIKMRVVLNLQEIQNARIALRGAIPQEIIEIICGQFASSIIGSRHEILLTRPEETAQLAETIKSQIRKVYGAIETYNSHFWELMVKDPDAGVLQRPFGTYTQGSGEEALMVIRYSNASWYEMPGAVDCRSLSTAG
ncbi:zinc finger domain-containing protein [Metarhizium robertsii ARSEF 23]|uniref:Zinc finger domain-containing protein n=1 Tax=Metarhizium robertsii (strain ARSEF 23 / ATCC MYA-3075) TaxID=655844 RepID=E9FCQ8_METRA|nr:zinc finger domain-containing protein [Metarhizium robertsii ARSEF 23]EFY94478.1 zinc finger domain-containing protein [Metarhizium robertsii ARSEF 23]